MGLLPMQNITFSQDTDTQTVEKRVVTEPTLATPGVYWYQLDNGDFRVDYYEGGRLVSKDVRNAGTNMNPIPERASVRNETHLMNHVSGPLIFYDDDRNKYTLNQLMSYRLYKARFDEKSSFKGVNMWVDQNDPNKLIYYVETGQGYDHDDYQVFSTRYGTNYPKVLVMYMTPIYGILF